MELTENMKLARDLRLQLLREIWRLPANYFLAQHHEKVLKWLDRNGKRNERVLEVGCNEGRFTEKFMRKFPDRNLHAFDISRECVEMTAGRCDLTEDPMMRFYGGKENRVTLTQEDVLEGLNLENEHFNKVVIIMVMHHIDPEYYKGVFSEIHRLLKRGGEAIVIEPGLPKTRLGTVCWHLFKGHAFSNACIEKAASAAKDAGFTDQTYLGTPYFGWTHTLVLTK